MALRVDIGKTNNQRAAVATGALQAVARSPILVGALVTVALLAMFAVNSPPSGAVTVATAKKPTITAPAVSPVTVTVPGVKTPPVTVTTGKTPPVTVAPVKVPPVVTPRVGTTPSLSTTAAPGATAPSVSAFSAPGSAISAPASASLPSGRSAATRYTQSAASAQQRLRSVVVRLSQCLSALNPGSQRMLLLRAGIGTAQPDSPGAIARALRITVGREARVEHAALLQLQAADRERRCGSPPAWLHVPAQDRLVPVDAVLTSPSEPARATHVSSGSRDLVGAIGNGSGKLWFTPGEANWGSPLVLGVSYEWGNLMWMPAQQG